MLSKVKTPQRFHRVVSTSPWKTEYSGRRWTSCRLSTRLLKLSMRLDWHHWDHWATVHDDCQWIRCRTCGGKACDF